MDFWALANKHEEDFFYDFETGKDTDYLSETCFLPTKEAAELLIKLKLDERYAPVLVELREVNRSGHYCVEPGPVEFWDNESNSSI